MLVLTRKRNESIVVNGVTISVMHIGGSKVKIGIDATDDVPIVRGELIEEGEDDAE